MVWHIFYLNILFFNEIGLFELEHINHINKTCHHLCYSAGVSTTFTIGFVSKKLPS